MHCTFKIFIELEKLEMDNLSFLFVSASSFEKCVFKNCVLFLFPGFRHGVCSHVFASVLT